MRNAFTTIVVTLGMFWHAGINKGAGKSDVGGTVDGTVVDNGCHGLSVNLEYQLLGRPKYAIAMERSSTNLALHPMPVCFRFLFPLAGYCCRPMWS
jgi:hypothetical protein